MPLECGSMEIVKDRVHSPHRHTKPSIHKGTLDIGCLQARKAKPWEEQRHKSHPRKYQSRGEILEWRRRPEGLQRQILHCLNKFKQERGILFDQPLMSGF